MTLTVRMPYIWSGGKRAVAEYVWQRLGNVKTYVEPFAGGAAVFWLRPAWHWDGDGVRWEHLNDADGFIANFLRAVQADPLGVGHWADNPIIEQDLHARHVWLVNQRSSLTERLEGDPDYYDVKIAGWWVWGLNNWLSNSDWCIGNGNWFSIDGRLVKAQRGTVESEGVQRFLPSMEHHHLGYQSGVREMSEGVQRFRPQMGHAVQGYQSGVREMSEGVTRSRPQMKNVHQGFQSGVRVNGRDAYWLALQERFRRSVVKVAAGGWERVVTPSCTIHSGTPVGIFFDPPYASDRADVYAVDSHSVHLDVAQWSVKHGSDPRYRIAVCGYEGYYEESLGAAGWQCYRWQAGGGMSNQNRDKDNQNKHREVIWFSPHCLPEEQPPVQETLL